MSYRANSMIYPIIFPEHPGNFESMHGFCQNFYGQVLIMASPTMKESEIYNSRYWLSIRNIFRYLTTIFLRRQKFIGTFGGAPCFEHVQHGRSPVPGCCRSHTLSLG